MQDDSNLRLPLKNHVCQVKMYLFKSKTPPTPNIKYLLRKNILLLLSYTYYTIHNTLITKDSMYLYNQCHCLHHALHSHFS